MSPQGELRNDANKVILKLVKMMLDDIDSPPSFHVHDPHSP